MNNKTIALLIALVLAAAPACLRAQSTQTEEQSLADAARENQKKKAAHAKIVITDENLNVRKGPIPSIQIKGTDNSDEILDAIWTFRAAHTPQETEETVRGWFNEYDNRLSLAIQEVIRFVQVHGIENTNPGPLQPGEDPRRTKEQVLAEYRSVVGDAYAYNENVVVITRVQQTFERVRAGLRLKGMKYDWMKIRFANGNGSW